VVHKNYILYIKILYWWVLEEDLAMAEKKFIAICLICIILVTGLVGVTMLLNQKEDEIKIKTEQFIEMEDQKNSLENQLASS
jgi:hypothetical protein